MDKKKKQEQEKREPEAERKAESEAAASKEPEAPAEPETAPSELELARAEAEDYKRKWYAVTAEYENYRKRTASVGAQRYLDGRADIVKGLLPIADNLDLALQSCADEATKKGVSMVLASFSNLLKDEHIEVIDPTGKPFDAGESEAILAVDAEEGEESGTVRQVYRKGYKQGDRVLRYAQVVVVK